MGFNNNIFSNIDKAYVSIGTNVAEKSYLQSNLFWNNGAPIPIRWGANQTTISTSAHLNKLTTGKNNVVSNPLFVDATDGDFHLQHGSGAIDNGNNILEILNNDFKVRFGDQRTILVDYDGITRPISGRPANAAIYDIGAFEFLAEPRSAVQRHAQ